MPSLWGYARASKEEQEQSPEQQAALIEACALALPPEMGELQHVVKEFKSATSVPYFHRQGMAELLTDMKKGDTLIVWRSDRIDRNPLHMIGFMSDLLRRGIHLINLELMKDGGDGVFNPLDEDHRTKLILSALVSNIGMAQQGRAIKVGLKHRKDGGLAYTRYPPYGKVRIHIQGKHAKPDKYDRWDRDECILMCELELRRMKGETLQSIAHDWYLRRLKRASTGKPWISKRVKQNGKRYVDSVLENASKKAKEYIAEDGAIGGVQLDDVYGAAQRGGAPWTK